MKQVETILNDIAQESGFDNWEQYFECFLTTEPGRRVINKGIRKAVTKALFLFDVRQRIIDYTNWLSKQNLMICEGVDGYTFRSSTIGGKKYSAEELYDKFVSEYVA